ncbi:MAG TPA: DUF2752 domain-containing protein [Candidatus Acidoferrum sp.]|nr:DUF2752 domain-containing protein [Candidatus Acidoferrum sp.]
MKENVATASTFWAAKRVIWLLVAVAFITSAALLYRFNPIEHGFYPRCMFRIVTGWDCPGCGGLRATHQLLHGNVRAAFDLNPLLVCVLPIAAVFVVWWMRTKEQSRSCASFLQNPKLLWSLAAIVIAFGLLRNLPWRIWLS